MKHIPYARQAISKDDIKAVAKALKADYLTQGVKSVEFEKAVSGYCGARYAVALNSGTSALHAACFAAGVEAGDEVITSPVTFVASANAVLYCQAKPVFADIQADTLNIDPLALRRKITARTKAVIPVHFAGHPCDMTEIQALARKKKLLVIEDAAHALGAKYRRSKVGSCKYSDITVFSFHAVKHITTGEGGMLLTNNKRFYEKALMFRTHGITRDINRLVDKSLGSWYYEMQFLGYNYRLTDFQCALGLSQLNKLNKFIARRIMISKKYDASFQGIPGLSLQLQRKDVKHSRHLYVIRVKEGRDRIFKEFLRAGIGVNVHYLPVYLQPYYRKLGYKKGICPNAEEYYWQAITLPLYPRMSDADVKQVIRVTRSLIN